jgi:hypothetical protein
MITKPRDQKGGRIAPTIVRSRSRTHDSMLVLNMSIFGFTDA